MKDKTDWVVSFHSHKVPYSDVNEGGNGIALKNAFPTNDDVGKAMVGRGQYFDFYITAYSKSTDLEYKLLINKLYKLRTCNRNLPKDAGKDRPCLNYHMNQCAGWCQQGRTREDYLQRIGQARQLLSGNYKEVASEIRNQMLQAADNMEFELAAGLRDRLNAWKL